MVRVVYGKNFLKSTGSLPQEKPFHPFLHTKYLTGGLAGLLSFRITRDWRVIFQFISPDTIQLLRVKHRKDIY